MKKIFIEKPITQFIPNIDRKALKVICTRNSSKSILHLLWEWILIFSAIFLTEYFWNPLLYLISVMFLGSRIHALGILMHEATHHLLFKSKKWNDWIGDLFLAWPIFITVNSYRLIHLPHHHYLNSDYDPDWVTKRNEKKWKFPQNKKSLFLLFLKDLFGLNTVEQIARYARYAREKDPNKKQQSSSKGYYNKIRLAYYVGILGIMGYCSVLNLFFFYWIVPHLTWFKMVLRMRSIGEHFGLEKTTLLNASRTTYINWFERVFILPKNINFHLDHHLLQFVPFYNLPQFHQFLLSYPVYAQNAHITKQGSWGVLNECTQ